jgi:signal transduction histidine kinase/CheY-like chemotaxis protein
MDPDHGGKRDQVVTARESAVGIREDAAAVREQTQRDVADEQSLAEVRMSDVREANTHLVIATLAAEELNEVAQQTKRRQDEFLAMLAHELRNPLAPIRSAGALLARLDIDDPRLKLIQDVLQRQVAHMARLLDDLLDASRVTSGKVNLQRQPTAVGDFVDQAVETCRALIDLQRQQLTVDLSPEPVYVDGDSQRLAQAVGNLLHNAAKYTPEGGRIALSVWPAGDTVVITVSDDGAGIPADVLPHIFDLFRQEDRSLSRSQGGLGIGLTVARGMVELHGGRIEVHSDGPGEGSEFVITLPRMLRPVEPVPAPPGSPAPAPAGVRILLVDDHIDAGLLLAMLLRMSGHEVEIAHEGATALDLFARQRPHVVVCDIGLPGMNGYDVAEHIRGLRNGRPVLMVALTGYDGPEHRARAHEVGFDHHVVKPVDFEALLALVDAWVLAGADASAGGGGPAT